MKNILKKSLALALLIYVPFNSMAWGMLGHRIVGQVAETHLNAKTRKEIAKILGSSSLAMEANWMDFIKSDPSFRYLNNWHYINFAQNLSYPQVQEYLKKDTTTNVYTKINFVSSELKKKATPPELKLMYLRILVHLVGDLHQPMHVGRAEDQGGNEIRVTWFNKQMNLHSLWDSDLIEFQQLSYTEYANAINHPSKQQVKTWQSDDMSKWVFESYVLADELYKEAEKNQKYSFRYNFDHIKTVDQQLLKGGVRLAGLLNNIFGS
ncbi:S1/P1 nuclease [Pedobacter sp. SYSU D00535]|uniref:S1/P1 nuclease n=1 Tax=Pedobacter sp. SYSU D00535 TaxID=2810308 RepID=UPI001A95896D|nr:S1/P1 nuclease [Pedobacter sp. SYSU D00535]